MCSCFCVGGGWRALCVCVFLYGDHKERQKRVKKLNICALRMRVCVCGWVCLPDLISTARLVLLTVYVLQVKGKRKQTPKSAYAQMSLL